MNFYYITTAPQYLLSLVWFCPLKYSLRPLGHWLKNTSALFQLIDDLFKGIPSFISASPYSTSVPMLPQIRDQYYGIMGA